MDRKDEIVKRVHEFFATPDAWTEKTRREYNRLMDELGTILAHEEKSEERRLKALLVRS